MKFSGSFVSVSEMDYIILAESFTQILDFVNLYLAAVITTYSSILLFYSPLCLYLFLYPIPKTE